MAAGTPLLVETADEGVPRPRIALTNAKARPTQAVRPLNAKRG